MPSLGLFSLCTLYLTRVTGGESGYSWVDALHTHISMLPDFQTGRRSCLYVWEPTVFGGGRATYCFIFSMLPDFQTGFSRSRYEAWWCFSLLQCSGAYTYTYNLINAARFSDGLGLQYRSRYEAGCCQFTALVGTLQQHIIIRNLGKRYDGITCNLSSKIGEKLHSAAMGNGYIVNCVWSLISFRVQDLAKYYSLLLCGHGYIVNCKWFLKF